MLWARLALIAFSALIGVLLILQHHGAIGAAFVAMAGLRLFIVLRTRHQLEARREWARQRFGR